MYIYIIYTFLKIDILGKWSKSQFFQSIRISKKKLKQILKNAFFIASISLECNLTPNFQNHRSIDNGGDGFCGQKK